MKNKNDDKKLGNIRAHEFHHEHEQWTQEPHVLLLSCRDLRTGLSEHTVLCPPMHFTSGPTADDLAAFSGCLRALLHHGAVLPPGWFPPANAVRELLGRFDVHRYVAAEVGDGIVDENAQPVDGAGGAACAPERLVRAFKSAADALRLDGAEQLGCGLLEVKRSPAQRIAI
eukprot:scaffold344067_cov32-Prasinocladus_malaysianus.AAC.2